MSGVNRPSSNACAHSQGSPRRLGLTADRAPCKVLLHRARRRVVSRSVAEVPGAVELRRIGGRGREPLVHHRRELALRGAAEVGPDQAHPERELQHRVRHERIEDEVRCVPGLEGAERDPVRVDRRVVAPDLAEVRVQAALRIPAQRDPRAVDVEVRMGQRPGRHVEEVADLGRPRDARLPAGVAVTAGRVAHHHVPGVGEGACVRRVVGVVLGRTAAVEHLEQREAGARRRAVGKVHVGVQADGLSQRVRRRHRDAVGADAERGVRLRGTRAARTQRGRAAATASSRRPDQQHARAVGVRDARRRSRPAAAPT